MKNKKLTLSIILVIIFAISILTNIALGTFYANIKSKNLDNDSSEENLSPTTDIEILKKRLGKILLLPQEEKPTIFIIDETEPLKEKQPDFYKNANVDDIVFVYESMAIIYRQTSNQIIKYENLQLEMVE